jgi:hypothetical protein
VILIADVFIMLGFLILAIAIGALLETCCFVLASDDRATDIVVMSLCVYGW